METRRVRTLGTIAAAVLLVALFDGLGQIDAALSRVEVPGYSSTSATGVFSLSPEATASNARTAWCVWHRFTPPSPAISATQGTPTDPGPAARVAACLDMLDTGVVATYRSDTDASVLLRSYVAVDTVFAVGYAIGLLVLLRRLRRRISADSGDPVDNGVRIATQRRFAGIIIGTLAGAELVENAMQWILSDPNAAPTTVLGVTNVLFWATGLKWLAATVAGLLIVALAVRGFRESFSPLRTAVKHLRLPIAILVVFGFVLSGVGTDQVQDALLATSYAQRLLIFTVVAAIVLTLQVWRSAHRTVLTVGDRTHGPLRPWFLPLAALLAAAASVFWRNLLGLAAVAALVWLLSWFAGAAWWRNHEPESAAGLPQARRETQSRSQALPEDQATAIRQGARRLAAVPFLLLGLFMVRSATATALLGPDRDQARRLVIVGVALAVIAVWVPSVLRALEQRWAWAKAPSEGGNHWLNLGLAVLSVAVAVTVYVDPYGLPVLAGPIAMVTFFLGLLLAGLSELQRWAEYRTPVAGLRMLGFRRTPVFILLALWFVIASLADVDGHNEVRLIRADVGTPAVDLQEQLVRWAEANCATAGPRSDEPAYMVFVAASGGGIRAAYWSAGVLDRLFPSGTVGADASCPLTNGHAPVFAISGASGGSLGAVSWLSRTPADSTDGASPWFKKAFGADYLTSAVSWLLYFDIPRSLVGWPGQDRAGVLEQALEHAQPALQQSFLGMYAKTSTWTPLALLNGTVAESGCRALMSLLSIGPFDQPPRATTCRRRPEDHPRGTATDGAAVTLTDLRGNYLCAGQDVRRSTAALLSGRFPYITPSGQLKQCDGEGRVSVVDGGYVDSTGSLTAVDLYQEVKPLIDCHNEAFDQSMTSQCQQLRLGQPVPTRRIEPVFIQIDNGYESVAEPPVLGRPHELLLPPLGYLKAAATSDAGARQRAFIAFGCGSYLRFANQRNPGTEAPLGWAMSASAQTELDSQLALLPIPGNDPIASIRGQRAAATSPTDPVQLIQPN